MGLSPVSVSLSRCRIRGSKRSDEEWVLHFPTTQSSVLCISLCPFGDALVETDVCSKHVVFPFDLASPNVPWEITVEDGAKWEVMEISNSVSGLLIWVTDEDGGGGRVEDGVGEDVILRSVVLAASRCVMELVCSLGEERIQLEQPFHLNGACSI